MNKKICLLPGDGIGPEVVQQAEMVLASVEKVFGHSFETKHALIGGIAIDKTGSPLPEATLEICRESDAILLGAVGGPKWDGGDVRPEQGLLAIRKELALYANLRPAILFPQLASASFLRPDLVRNGLDLLIVRELTGGIYFGEPKGEQNRAGEQVAFNTMIYSESEVRRICRLAFSLAEKRSGRLCSVDKANVLEVSRLWRRIAIEVGQEYPQVELSHLYVDNAAMQLICNPSQFDVIVTGNLFGDILSDEAAVMTGSIGMLPSASIGDDVPSLYEPVHGSAPDIAGKNLANPLATILSLAMMFRYGFSLPEEAKAVEQAVTDILAAGWRCHDIMQTGKKQAGCAQMGQLVCEQLEKNFMA